MRALNNNPQILMCNENENELQLAYRYNVAAYIANKGIPKCYPKNILKPFLSGVTKAVKVKWRGTQTAGERWYESLIDISKELNVGKVALNDFMLGMHFNGTDHDYMQYRKKSPHYCALSLKTFCPAYDFNKIIYAVVRDFIKRVDEKGLDSEAEFLCNYYIDMYLKTIGLQTPKMFKRQSSIVLAFHALLNMIKMGYFNDYSEMLMFEIPKLDNPRYCPDNQGLNYWGANNLVREYELNLKNKINK